MRRREARWVEIWWIEQWVGGVHDPPSMVSCLVGDEEEDERPRGDRVRTMSVTVSREIVINMALAAMFQSKSQMP